MAKRVARFSSFVPGLTDVPLPVCWMMEARRDGGGRFASLPSFALLWLAGNCLRLTILSVPPLLPTIHRVLRLNEGEVGALTSLPVLLLAAGAIPGSLLIARGGARRTLILGLLLIAVAGAARGIAGSALVLFAMTFIMGIGIAISQPALPSLVREWFPARTAVATAVYSNGFLIGEIVAASVTVPLLLSVLGGWDATLAVWSIPVMVVALAVALNRRGATPSIKIDGTRWWPDWRNGLIWRVGLIFGGASTAYFTSNAFIPTYLQATHHAAYITPALISLNLSQLPATFVVAILPRHIIGRRLPVIAFGLLTIVAAASFGFGGVWVPVFAALMGFSTANVFVLSLALPPILAARGDVHRFSSAIFAIAYACPFFGSLLGGFVWDTSGFPLAAFGPVALAGILMAVLAFDIPAARVAVPEAQRAG
ncbi:MAG: CynX/NimT family MFS transporter [Chloroflexota bacterium]